MEEFITKARCTLGQMALWGLATFVAAFLAGRADLIPGLALGTLTSVIYFLLMCYRVKKMADLPPARAVLYVRTGWLLRLLFISLMLVVSLHVPGVSFLAAVGGLFTLQIVLLLKAVVFVIREFRFSK